MSSTNDRKSVEAYFDRKSASFDALYGQTGDEGEASWFNRTFRSAIFRRMRRTFELMQECEGPVSVLDVGCGSGRVATLLARGGAQRVVGVDFSEDMIELARKRAREQDCADRCEFHVADFMDFEPDGEFTIVAALGVFDYIQDPEPFFKRMAGFATDLALASFPGYSWWRTPQRKFRYWLRGCPVYFYTEEQIASLLEPTDSRRQEIEDIGDSCFLGIAHLSDQDSSRE